MLGLEKCRMVCACGRNLPEISLQTSEADRVATRIDDCHGLNFITINASDVEIIQV